MKKLILSAAIACLSLANVHAQQGGATETTPSRSEYFSWINNTNEGATAEQTRINLDFFRWLHDKYGMELDIYAFDAGAIDGAKMYGSTKSDRFKRQFPEGFGPLSRQAADMNTRLGIWCGPDGFGNSEAEAKERADMMTGLVKDHNFGLFKMDAVCGQLRKDKYEPFDSMMTEIRRLSPDFVLLNHRLDLGPGTRHSTTFLLGGEGTRFLTLRNLSWQPVTYKIKLDSETGIIDNGKKVKARLYHPYIYDLGSHNYGDIIEVEVLPFRAALVKLTTQPEKDKVTLSGIPYLIINDKAGDDVEIKLLGMPGQTYKVKAEKGNARFTSAQIDGNAANALARGGSVRVSFPGKPFKEKYHRLIDRMQSCTVPADAPSLYYATCYAADNNALEVRSLARSGETEIPQVKAARDAFTGQEIFRARDLWDRYLFDGDESTCFSVKLRHGDRRAGNTSALYLDLGESVKLDELVFKAPDEYAIAPYKSQEGALLWLSDNLVDWKPITFIVGTKAVADTRDTGEFRYVRLSDSPLRLSEIEGWRDGKAVDRSKWHASNLFREYNRGGCETRHAWKSEFTLDEFADGAYLCVALNGHHGREGAWAAMKVDGRYVGCPDRAPSFTSNTWEHLNVETDSNNTYYIPLTPDMLGKKLEVYALSFESSDLKPEVWITNYPIPFSKKTLTLKK